MAEPDVNPPGSNPGPQPGSPNDPDPPPAPASLTFNASAMYVSPAGDDVQRLPLTLLGGTTAEVFATYVTTKALRIRFHDATLAVVDFLAGSPLSVVASVLNPDPPVLGPDGLPVQSSNGPSNGPSNGGPQGPQQPPGGVWNPTTKSWDVPGSEVDHYEVPVVEVRKDGSRMARLLRLTLASFVAIFINISLSNHAFAQSDASFFPDASASMSVATTTATTTVTTTFATIPGEGMPVIDPASITSAVNSKNWYYHIGLGIAILGWLFRLVTNSKSANKVVAFLHSAQGLVVVALVNAGITSTVGALQAHAPPLQCAISAVSAFFSTAIAMSSPALPVRAAAGAAAFFLVFSFPELAHASSGSNLGGSMAALMTCIFALGMTFLLLRLVTRRRAILGFLLASSMAVSGCACFKTGWEQVPSCVILHQTLDCTKQAASSLFPIVGSLLSSLVSSGSVDWTYVEQRLEAAGAVDGTCIFAQISNDLSTKAAATPEHLGKAKETLDRFKSWKANHGAAGVSVKIKTADGKLVTL